MSSTSLSSRSSSKTSLSAMDEDAITPCSVELYEGASTDTFTSRSQQTPTEQINKPSHQSHGHARRSSWASGISTEEVGTELLWRRMLAVQRRFGCYNSARMQAALDAGTADSAADEYETRMSTFPYPSTAYRLQTWSLADV